MQTVYQRCCGIDIHKKMIIACLLICTAQGVEKEIQTFTTMVQDLYRLRDWLKAKHCQAVAMESTGVYWKPIWNVLEEEMELLLVNAHHIKAVPGRKPTGGFSGNGSASLPPEPLLALSTPRPSHASFQCSGDQPPR